MDSRNRRKHTNLYTKEQIKRVLTGTGVTIESEVDSDYIIFCPYHNNNRTPAGEIDKHNGTFFCFACHHVTGLTEFVMHMSNRTYFEAARFIKSKETETSIETDIDRALYKKPEFIMFDELVLKRLHNNLLESERAKNYFNYRKINKESSSKFSLGYSENQKHLLITSAFHMYRSKGCFDKANLNTDTFPVDYYGHESKYDLPSLLYPDPNSIFIWQKLFKEWIGIVMYKMTGYL
jgi:hypothetical protein